MLFNLVSVPFDYEPGAPEPTAWLQFLASLWADDAESIMLLQEFCGYVLSGRTDMHMGDGREGQRRNVMPVESSSQLLVAWRLV